MPGRSRVYASGSPGLLTAGHCFPYNVYVWQGDWVHYNPAPGSCSSANPPSPCSHLLGWVTTQVNGGGSQNQTITDGEFVDVHQCCSSNVAGRVWANGANYNSLSVTGTRTNFQGLNVCTGGAVTTQDCTGTVVGGPECVTISSVVYCNLWRIQSTITDRTNPWSTLIRLGDSGGPVYQSDGNGGVLAMGLNQSCQVDGTNGSNCSGPNFWYADINAVTSQLNISLRFNG